MQSDTVAAAYTEIGRAYEVAVDVSKFSWQMFQLRVVAVFSGAAYVTFVWHQPAIGVVALLGSIWMTWFVTRIQLDGNQRVIQKALASGFVLELTHGKELGSKYAHDIHLLASEKERIVRNVLLSSDPLTKQDRFAYTWFRLISPRVRQYAADPLQAAHWREHALIVKKYRTRIESSPHPVTVDLADLARFGIYPNTVSLAVSYAVFHSLFIVAIVCVWVIGIPQCG